MSAPTRHAQIHVIYPKLTQEIYDDNTFVMGQIRGAQSPWRLVINGHDVPVSPHGFFAWKINLHPGMNPVKIQVYENSGTHPEAEDLFALHRMPPYATPAAAPLTVVAETMKPASDVWLTAQDNLTVACLASVSAKVSVTIPGLIETPVLLHPVTETKVVPVVGEYIDTRERVFAQPHWTQKRIPAKGYYHAVIPLADHVSKHPMPLENLPIVLHVSQGSHSIQKNFPGHLTVLKNPRVAKVQQQNAVARISPEDGERLTPQKSGTQILVDGLKANWVRVRLDGDEHFYLDKDAVQFLNGVHALPAAHLETVQIVLVNEHVARVNLNVSGNAYPIQIEALPPSGPNRLHVRLYNVQAESEVVQSPSTSHRVQQVHWRPVGENTVELWVDLDRPLTGYDYALQNGQWHLTVKTLPTRIEDIRVLIDPGHGGPENGAIGLNGIPEKSLNLTVSKLLEKALKAEGFQTAMTRVQDVEVSLAGRQEKAVHENADIILSIHHNALPDDRDPLKAVGACTFYYQPFSKLLAEVLLKGLTVPQENFSIPNFGLFNESLFIPRIHQALSVLIEVGFFTNPKEFERLINPAFQQEVAHRIAKSLRQYCLSQANLSN